MVKRLTIYQAGIFSLHVLFFARNSKHVFLLLLCSGKESLPKNHQCLCSRGSRGSEVLTAANAPNQSLR